MKHTDEIMRLADAYASQLQVCNFDDADKARDALEAALSAKQGEQDAVAWRTEVEYGKLLFHIGVQSFAIDYTPEDEPDFSAGDAMAWMEQRLREALSKLAHPAPVNQPELCCGEYKTCMKACTPRGKAQADQQLLEACKAALSDDQPYIEKCRAAIAAVQSNASTHSLNSANSLEVDK